MTMVTTDDRNRQLSAALAGTGLAITAKAARRVLAAYMQGPQQRVLPSIQMPQQRSSGGRSKPSRNRAGKRAAGTVGKTANAISVPRNVAGATTAAVTLRGIYAIGNGSTAGQCSAYITLGMNTSGSASALGSVLGNAAQAYSSMYRQFRLQKLTVQFIPSVPNTAGGQVGLGVDSDPLAGSPNNFGNVIRHKASCFTPIFQESMLVWTPSNSREREDKHCLPLTHTEDMLSPGVLQIFSQNTIAASGNLGSLWLEATMVYSMPS